jgi:hypothetical protein
MTFTLFNSCVRSESAAFPDRVTSSDSSVHTFRSYMPRLMHECLLNTDKQVDPSRVVVFPALEPQIVKRMTQFRAKSLILTGNVSHSFQLHRELKWRYGVSLRGQMDCPSTTRSHVILKSPSCRPTSGRSLAMRPFDNGNISSLPSSEPLCVCVWDQQIETTRKTQVAASLTSSP